MKINSIFTAFKSMMKAEQFYFQKKNYEWIRSLWFVRGCRFSNVLNIFLLLLEEKP